jgi:hypothetical protein
MRIVLLCFLIFISGCRKTNLPEPISSIGKVDVFSVKELKVSNGDELNFDLKTEGIHTMTLFDSVGQQVITRERIAGKIGQNTLNIYTKSLPIRYLYLSLEDVNNVQIGRTLLILN